MLQDVSKRLVPTGDTVIGQLATTLPISQDPILVHVHIPKCAGTSLGAVLRASFPGRHLDVYAPFTDLVYTPDQLSRLLRDNPQLVSIASHAIRVYPSLINGRTALYVCFLRDPVEQFLSYLTYIKKQYSTLSPPHRLVVPPKCDRLSMRRIAEWLVTHSDDVPFRQNYTIRFLTERLFLQQVEPLPNSPLHLSLTSFYEKINLDLAMSVLERFLFVGIVDQMETSLHVLQQKLAPYGLVLETTTVPMDNVSRDYREDLGWMTESDRVGKLVLDSLADDIRLYEHIRRSFARMAEEHAVTTPRTDVDRG